ncbi:hypothetical protein Tco_0311604 [Tanacetum coccineum]
MKIQDLIEKRIEIAGQHLNKEKQIMRTNKGKEKMVMEREVIIIELDTSYDYFPAQTTSDERSNHNPFQATSNESFDHNHFQVTSNESSDDTLKSSSEDTCSSDYAKKNTIPSEIVQWYDDYQGLFIKVDEGQALEMQQSQNLKNPNQAVTTWQRILNKEFGIISSKEDVGGSLNVRSKGKRKML